MQFLKSADCNFPHVFVFSAKNLLFVAKTRGDFCFGSINIFSGKGFLFPVREGIMISALFGNSAFPIRWSRVLGVQKEGFSPSLTPKTRSSWEECKFLKSADVIFFPFFNFMSLFFITKDRHHCCCCGGWYISTSLTKVYLASGLLPRCPRAH